jgi:hypothetical protein
VESAEKYMAWTQLNAGNPAEYGDGLKWQHDCVFDSGHTKPDAFTILAHGWLNHYCSHDSCSEYRDADWREKFEEQNGETFPYPSQKRLTTAEIFDGFNAGAADHDPSPKPVSVITAVWNDLAAKLDIVRNGTEEFIEKGKTKEVKLPKHIAQERVYQFALKAFEVRSKFLFDAYPYIYLDDEAKIVKFHDDGEAMHLLSRLRLRITQPDTNLVRENLALHILKNGAAVRVEKFGVMQGECIYINNGRGGVFKLDGTSIEEVINGTDGVYLLAPELLPFPELTSDNLIKMKALNAKLGRYGLKVGDTPLCNHLAGLFEEGGSLNPAQYHQLIIARFLSFFLASYLKLRPIMLAIGEQNSGKSTLFEKMMWLLTGLEYESEALPQDLRSFLAAVTNHHMKLFDNIDGSDIEELGYIDLACKCASGGKIPIAQLYETNVERKFDLRCDLMFTARQNPFPSHRSDLSRRTLFFPIRKPEKHEYKTVESMQEELWSERETILIELLLRLNKICKAINENRHKKYDPISEMHSFETYTMRVADHEGWAEEMVALWKGYMGDYQEKIIEDSPIVSAFLKWLGRPAYDPATKRIILVNVGRKATVEEIYNEMMLSQCKEFTATYKNSATFGKAIKRNWTALRVLGAAKGQDATGRRFLLFTPSETVRQQCKLAYDSRMTRPEMPDFGPDDADACCDSDEQQGLWRM